MEAEEFPESNFSLIVVMKQGETAVRDTLNIDIGY